MLKAAFITKAIPKKKLFSLKIIYYIFLSLKFTKFISIF